MFLLLDCLGAYCLAHTWVSMLGGQILWKLFLPLPSTGINKILTHHCSTYLPVLQHFLHAFTAAWDGHWITFPHCVSLLLCLVHNVVGKGISGMKRLLKRLNVWYRIQGLVHHECLCFQGSLQWKHWIQILRLQFRWQWYALTFCSWLTILLT